MIFYGTQARNGKIGTPIWIDVAGPKCVFHSISLMSDRCKAKLCLPLSQHASFLLRTRVAAKKTGGSAKPTRPNPASSLKVSYKEGKSLQTQSTLFECNARSKVERSWETQEYFRIIRCIGVVAIATVSVETGVVGCILNVQAVEHVEDVSENPDVKT